MTSNSTATLYQFDLNFEENQKPHIYITSGKGEVSSLTPRAPRLFLTNTGASLDNIYMAYWEPNGTAVNLPVIKLDDLILIVEEFKQLRKN